MIKSDCFGEWGRNPLCGICVYTKECDKETEKEVKDDYTDGGINDN